MTVDTPFPDRPATPFWNPRGKWGGMGDVTTDIASIAQSADQAYLQTLQYQPGTYTQSTPYGTTTYVAPAGSAPMALPGTATVTASSSGGFMLLLLAGAALYFMSRR